MEKLLEQEALMEQQDAKVRRAGPLAEVALPSGRPWWPPGGKRDRQGRQARLSRIPPLPPGHQARGCVHSHSLLRPARTGAQSTLVGRCRALGAPAEKICFTSWKLCIFLCAHQVGMGPLAFRAEAAY